MLGLAALRARALPGRRLVPRPLALALMSAAALFVSALLFRAAPPVAAAAPAGSSVVDRAASSEAAGEAGSFSETALKWATATVFTAALALVSLSFLRKGRAGRPAAPLIAVRHQTTLGRGASIALVEAGGTFLLVGVGPEGVSRLKEFSGEEAVAIRATLPEGARGAFTALLSGLAARAGGRS